MEVSGFQVVVMLVLVIVIMMLVAMVMGVSIIAQNNHADTVDDKTQNRHQDSLVKHNLDRVQQTYRAFEGHNDRENAKQHSAAETAQRIDFAGTKTEVTVRGIASGVAVGKGSNTQCCRMRSHVQPVCQ